MNTKLLNNLFITAMLVMTLVFIGCSSSSSSGPSGPGNGGTNLSTMVAVGAMTKGSVKVNGVDFQVNASTTITADDNPKPETFLDDGMTVKVKGTVNADGVTGTAEKVEVVNEVRGAIAAPPGTDTVTVHGQTVLIDGGTVLAGGATSIADLAQGENVEVHGGRDDTGVIHATRVEKVAAGGQDEVRGAVSGKTDTSFNIGSLTITFDINTQMVPTTATTADFVNGDVVEVHLSGTGATQITVEHLDHPEFEHVEGQELSVQGILKGFSQTSAFSVGTQQVQMGASTRIDGGVLADLVDGMKVEAEGHNVANGVLTAEKITIKDNIRIEANADQTGSADAVSVLSGKSVAITSGTRLSNLTGGAAILGGDGLRIRGFINRDGTTITATRVDKQSNPVQSDKTIIQGPVSTIDPTGHTFKILGITVSADTATQARPNDDSSNDNNVQTMSLDGFFSSLADGQTVVKAKGTFSAGGLAATEIELE